MKTFCTYFDSRYLNRGLALWESLQRHAGAFELYVLCLDDEARAALTRLALPGLHTIALEELEADDPELLRARPTRSTIEYYFTLTPSLPLYILRRRPELEFITYLDADLFFFDSPEPLWQELGDGAVAIIAHRFPPPLQHLAKYGIFNVGCLIFRNDARGRTILEWWRERCIEWCFDRIEDDRFADQKYLDTWPERFPGTVVLAHPGANVAPWNVGGSMLTERDGRVLVNGAPLVFYHFHRLREWVPSLWQLGVAQYRTRPTPLLIARVYRPYITALYAWNERIRAAGARPRGGTARAVARIRPGQLVRSPWYLATRELIVHKPPR